MVETYDQAALDELIRHRAKVALHGSSDDAALKLAFKNAMRPRVKRLLTQKKREVEEGLSAFLGAAASAVGRGVASELGKSVGIKGSTITTLAHAAFSTSKPKSTTKIAASKKPKTKTKKKISVSSTSSNSSQPIAKSSLFKASPQTATANAKTVKANPMSSKFKAKLKSSTAGFKSPMSSASNVSSISAFKHANRNKIKKMHEEKPTNEGDKE